MRKLLRITYQLATGNSQNEVERISTKWNEVERFQQRRCACIPSATSPRRLNRYSHHGKGPNSSADKEAEYSVA